MKLDKVERLLAKYYEGETTLEEENELKAFFNQTRLLPDHLKSHAAQFTCFNRQEVETIDKFISEDWLFQKITRPEAATAAAKPGYKFPAYLQIAASITLLLTAFFAGNYYSQRTIDTGNPEVAVLRQEVQEMQKVLASATLPTGASASERIQVVSQEFNPGQNGTVIQLLARTMNSDPNVNVRLAACEALYKLKDEPVARQALIQALTTQTNPLMQITLIDMVVALQEKKAVEPLKKLAGKPDLLPVVKYKAQEGLSILI